MITTPIFTRLLNTSEYGQYGVFNSWYGIVTIVVALALSSGVHTQGLVKFENEKELFSSSLQGLTITLVSVWTVIYILLREPINKWTSLSTVQTIAMLVMVWTSAAFHFWANDQRVRYQYRLLVIFTLIVSLISPFLK